MTIGDKRSLTFFIIAKVMVIAFSLYITQVDREAQFFYHLDVVFLELFFIPIVLACLCMGLAGDLATPMGVALLLLPYLILHWEGLSASDLNRVLRILVYFLASVTLSRVVLSQREEQKRAREAENLAAIGKSMAMVAHDISTPLISIGGLSSLVKNLHIDVADCDCGITPDKREDIFLPFFTTKKDGVGLGLDITKKIVESHGGYLEIVDNTKKGSIFEVVIPYMSGSKIKPT